MRLGVAKAAAATLRPLLWAVATAALPALGAEPAPSPQPTAPAAADSSAPTLAPGALYDAASARWTALPRAPFSTYEASFLALFHGKIRERRYRVEFRASDRQCLVTGVPLDERDRADAPQVTDRCFGPDYAFTFVKQKAASGAPIPLDLPTDEPSPAASDLRVIGSATARARPYAVSLVGDETIDGIRTAHLHLVPYRDPDRFIVRDLWIDRSDDAVVRLGAEAGFAGGMARASFAADYATRDDAGERLQRLTGYVKAQFLLIKGGADIHYEQTAYAFPAVLPESDFDPKAPHPSETAAPRLTPPPGAMPSPLTNNASTK